MYIVIDVIDSKTVYLSIKNVIIIFIRDGLKNEKGEKDILDLKESNVLKYFFLCDIHFFLLECSFSVSKL